MGINIICYNCKTEFQFSRVHWNSYIDVTRETGLSPIQLESGDKSLVWLCKDCIQIAIELAKKLMEMVGNKDVRLWQFKDWNKIPEKVKA
jgi:hypothetical protein